MSKSKQVNMASIVAASGAAVSKASASSAAEVGVTAKEAPVLAAIAANKAFVNVAALSKVKGVDAKSVPGIVASLTKKGFVANDGYSEGPAYMGTLYCVTPEGAEAAELLN